MNNDLPEKDALWDLLGRARPTAAPSHFFARNVLRSIRQDTPATAIPAFVLRWITAPAFAILLLGFTLSLLHSPQPQVPAELVEYFDIAAGLDQLAIVEDITISNFAANSL
jgi:hypothetical protein